MNRVGLHLRFTACAKDIIQQALRLKMPFFQCFLSEPKKGMQEQLSLDDREQFKKLLHDHHLKGYLHASYAINLASGFSDAGVYFLKKEIRIAQQCGFSSLVLHPGFATGCQTRLEGIDTVARRLNMITKKEQPVKILLENSAFGAHAIGGDLEDFMLLRAKLDKPEKIGFCIDTAHAYAYGYNIADDNQQDKFIELIGNTIGFDTVFLIHLNDTKEALNSKRDRHDIIGHGVIGAHYLRRFMQHERLISIPVLLELPVLPEHEQNAILLTVNSW